MSLVKVLCNITVTRKPDMICKATHLTTESREHMVPSEAYYRAAASILSHCLTASLIEIDWDYFFSQRFFFATHLSVPFIFICIWPIFKCGLSCAKFFPPYHIWSHLIQVLDFYSANRHKADRVLTSLHFPHPHNWGEEN